MLKQSEENTPKIEKLKQNGFISEDGEVKIHTKNR